MTNQAQVQQVAETMNPMVATMVEIIISVKANAEAVDEMVQMFGEKFVAAGMDFRTADAIVTRACETAIEIANATI